MLILDGAEVAWREGNLAKPSVEFFKSICGTVFECLVIEKESDRVCAKLPPATCLYGLADEDE